MFTRKAISQLSLVVAVLLWISFMVSDMFVVFGNTSNIDSGFSHNLPNIIFSLFIIAIYLFYKFKIGRAETVNFTDLLWRIFVTGLISTIISFSLKLFLLALKATRLAQDVLLLDFVYLINLALITVFLVSTFIVWKRLILYQKTKFLVRIWNVFEYALLFSLAYSALPFEIFPNLTLYYVVVMIMMGLFLSANMRWVAYLNFKQKWKSILLIFLTLLYLGYFSSNLYGIISVENQFNTDLWDNVFLLSLIAFIFIYALFSLLVILFNLPTSSVFEKKLEEVLNFQKLSQSIQTDQSEEQVYNLLLESAVSAVLADGAWIEVENQNELNGLYTDNISKLEIEQIKKQINHNTEKNKKQINKLKGVGYRSIIYFPINVQNQQIGMLALLKDVADGFDKDSSNIIKTFVTQAEVSVENSRLISQALGNER
ncbi:MAG: GAF domain-containing protein [Cyclobacteriaceae bacterium]|nr:GAF domain-containing protein [Cyclobacteriaceae bacterium]